MSAAARYPVRLGIQQRVLPDYRAPFFEALAAACEGGLSVFAGDARPQEGIQPAAGLAQARWHRARNLHLLHGPLYMCWQPGLRGWLDSWNPDALILEPNPRYLAAAGAMRWMRRRGRPVLGWGLGAPPLHGPLHALRAAARARFLRRFDALIGYGSLAAEQYRQVGFPPERVFIAFNAAQAPPPAPPARLPLAGRRARLLFVGRLQLRKRLDLLLAACAALDPPPELEIVGDGPARPALERLAAQVFPRARFAGAQHGADLEAAFARADLFVLPGTGGLAVQQAIGHALPVIVAEGDGTQRDLVRPENGWRIPAGDGAALAAALRQALSDPARLQRMGQASHRLATEEINIEAMVRSFVRALNSLARER